MKSIIKILILAIATINSAFCQVEMSKNQKNEFLKDLVTSFEDEYLWKEEGKQIANTLSAKIKNGDYSNIHEAAIFVATLNRDLYQLSNDLHLTIDLHNPKPNTTKKPSSSVKEKSFINIESVTNDIHYLKFDSFPRLNAAFEKEIDDLMSSLVNASTIILDLRDNTGGSDQTVNHIIGYFFKEKKKLATSYQWNASPKEIWTTPKTQSQKLSSVEIIILTSQSTFSAAEIFTQRLQGHGRATVVGEQTPGAAHRTEAYLMSDIFLLNWPYEQSKHAKDHQDIEAVGIVPDYQVHYNQAKKVAVKIAKKEKIKNSSTISYPEESKLTNFLIKALNSKSNADYQNFISTHVVLDSQKLVSQTLLKYKSVWNDNLNGKIINMHYLSKNKVRYFIKTNYGIRQFKITLNKKDKIVSVITR